MDGGDEGGVGVPELVTVDGKKTRVRVLPVGARE
jgi:hypothetical protein